MAFVRKIEDKKIGFTIRALDYNEIDDELIERWAELEHRAVDGNAYLSPCFIMPAVKFLSSKVRPIIICIEDSFNTLTGVGIFELSSGTREMPLPHLKMYSSPYSYLSGLLVDKRYLKSTLAAFFTFFCQPKASWYGVEFVKMYKDTRLAHELNAISLLNGVPWFEYMSNSRSILVLEKSGSFFMDKRLSRKRKNNIKKSYRILEKYGKKQWHLVSGRQVLSEYINNFLKLEHMGWKRKEGTSLLSQRNHEAFFREMINLSLKRGHVFFTELLLNNKVIASTCNLISGKAGFAFKIGWDPDYAKMSPGFLNEVEFVKNVKWLLPDLEFIDSGATEGSFIEVLWPEKRTLISGFYATSTMGRRVLFLFDFLRIIKRRFRKSI